MKGKRQQIVDELCIRSVSVDLSVFVAPKRMFCSVCAEKLREWTSKEKRETRHRKEKLMFKRQDKEGTTSACTRTPAVVNTSIA